MVGGFLAQMWDLYDQFISGMKTVAVSFEEKREIEFPTLAFCDSRGYVKKMPLTANAVQYNASTYNLDDEISLLELGLYDGKEWKNSEEWKNTYTTQLLPTVD